MLYCADVESLVLMAIKSMCRRMDAIKFSRSDNESFSLMSEKNFSETARPYTTGSIYKVMRCNYNNTIAYLLNIQEVNAIP